MIRRFLLKLLVRWYLKENREIHKLTVAEEFAGALLADVESSEKYIKGLLTAQTIRYWEAKNDMERDIVKGAGLILKTIRDNQKVAKEIFQHYPDEIEQLKEWSDFTGNKLRK